jgi:hypothetical protein
MLAGGKRGQNDVGPAARFGDRAQLPAPVRHVLPAPHLAQVVSPDLEAGPLQYGSQGRAHQSEANQGDGLIPHCGWCVSEDGFSSMNSTRARLNSSGSS